MKLTINAWLKGNFQSVYEEEFPKGTSVDLTPYSWDTKPEYQRVKIVTRQRVNSFIADDWHVTIYFLIAKPKFQIIQPETEAERADEQITRETQDREEIARTA